MMWQCDKIVTFVPSSRENVTFLEVLIFVSFWNLAASYWNLNMTFCDKNVTSHISNLVPVT